METNPKSFRKEHLAIRNAMSEKEVAEKSGVIVKRLLQTGWYQNAQEIFAYYPLKNEVDCRALFLQAWSDGKKIALPRTREENQMDFYYIDDFMQCEVTGGQFKTNIETTGFDYFGIDELPELAEEKNNKEQIAMCFNAMQSEKWEALFD